MVRRGLANSRLFTASAAPVALAAALGLQPAAAATLTIADMRRVVVLEQPAISPDGSRIALVVTRNEVNSLVLIDTASGSQTAIAHGGNVADPRWSPDGSVLAYLQENRPGRPYADLRDIGTQAGASRSRIVPPTSSIWRGARTGKRLHTPQRVRRPIPDTSTRETTITRRRRLRRPSICGSSRLRAALQKR